MTLIELKYIIREYQDILPRKVIHRNIDVPLDSQKIITLVGVRRSGKTFLLYQIISELLKKGIDKRQILFLNFEDERLEIDKPDLILQAYRELYPQQQLNDVYFFFDEIQALDKWEKFIFRLYELYRPKIFLTGSNSKLLSREIATQLRGRALSIKVYPLSFSEFLNFKEIEADYYSPRLRPKINQAFAEYLKYGGFPEVTLSEEPLKIQILQDYFSAIFYRDLIERYEIKNTTALNYLIKRIITNVGKPTSINKIYNELKSRNIKVSKDLLYSFTSFLEEIFLIFPVTNAGLSLNKQASGKKKFYFIDNGIITSQSLAFLENKGVLLENLVYLTLLRRGYEVFYLKDTYEVDFLAVKDSEIKLIQVSFVLNEQNIEREIRALQKARENYPLAEPVIITTEQNSELEGFRVVNVVEWLLEG